MGNKKKRRKIEGLIFLLCLILLSSCGNSNRQEKLIQAFASFEHSENYILRTWDTIYMYDKEIHESDIAYQNEPCEFVLLCEDGVYAYAYEPDLEYSLNILFISYETRETEYIGSIPLPDKVIEVTHYDGALCFRTNDPTTEEFKQLYHMFDLETAEYAALDTEELEKQIGYHLEAAQDFNRSERYLIESYNPGLLSLFHRNKLKITDKQTGESKILDCELLKTSEEGKIIYDYGKEKELGGFTAAYEKDGVIYVTLYHNTYSILGDPCHYFVMKYDFERHTLSYHTAVYFETYPSNVLEIYIPQSSSQTGDS